MPIGILVNSSAVAAGGIAGFLLRRVISDKLKESLIMYFGFGAVAIGIVAIIKMSSLPIVILALILGAIIGELLNIDGKLRKSLINILPKMKDERDEDKSNLLTTIIAIFCFSGTGLFGVFNEGFLGDSSILLAKAVLDFFSGMIFAASLGLVVSLIAVPQLIIFLLLFFLAKAVGPYLNEHSIANFIAVGGIITLMIGINMSKIKRINVLNLIPAFVVVLIISQIYYALL